MEEAEEDETDAQANAALEAVFLPFGHCTGFIQYNEDMRRSKVDAEKLIFQKDMLKATWDFVKELPSQRLTQIVAEQAILEVYDTKKWSIDPDKLKLEAAPALAKRLRTMISHLSRAKRSPKHPWWLSQLGMQDEDEGPVKKRPSESKAMKCPASVPRPIETNNYERLTPNLAETKNSLSDRPQIQLRPRIL